MFCPKCGKQNDENVNFCSSCGAKIQEGKVKVKKEKVEVVDSVTSDEDVKEPKVNSILSLVFAILLAPIGLIISIVGLVRSSKYKKKTGKSSSYIGLNIAGLVLSIIGTLIIGFVVVLFGGLFLLFSTQDKLLEGTWNCSKSIISSSYITEVKFDDGDIVWGKYNDVKNNNYKGSYSIKNREYVNNKNEYDVTFSLETKTIDGVTTSNVKDLDMKIKFNDNSATMSASDGETYYCTKAN